MASRRAWLAALALALAGAGCGGGEPDRALPDGAYVGLVTALDPASRTLVFDPVDLVGGAVVNAERSAHELTISTAIVVRLLDPCCDLHERSFEDWFAGFEPDDRTFYGTAASRYEITVDGGEVVLVEEVLVEG